MRLKDKSVNISALCPELLDRLNWMDIKQRQLVRSELVITSGNDSSHGPNSLHYKNRAIDTRINDWYCNVYMAARFLKELYEIFPDKDFDLIFEGDHLHIEYDPK